MRFFFLIILVAGIALGIGYPWAVDNVSGYEIGRYKVYDRASGFEPAEVALAPSEAPVRVLVDLTAAGEFRPSDRLTVLTVTASTGGATVFAETVTFLGVPPRPDSPQVAGYVYRDEVGIIDPVNGDARYIFTVGPGDADGIVMARVELVLRAGAFDLDPRAVPAGYILMAVGFVGLVAAFRLRGRKKTAADNGKTRRWGRGKDD
ncbi:MULTISPECIES: hypothetical protein [Nitratireductor]|uniref:hypothetical protein n=1 Tax=Nitratireductor TaxID=245876 RepID=UPI000D2A1584|nr:MULTISPECIES: hypothetical protein [Nitratireductor]PSM17100.1 hypothetical protein C7T96_16540 [Nitratireductor sp. StC3]